MKRLALILIALLCIVPLASAANIVNASFADVLEPWYKTSNVSTGASIADICSAYGQSTEAGYHWNVMGYAHNGLYSDTDNYRTVENPPGYMNLSPDNMDGKDYTKAYWFVRCFDGKFYASEVHPYYNSSAYLPPPIANFTGAPLIGTAPLSVAFTDNSQNEYGACVYNWSITPTGNVTGYVGTSENHNAVFGQNGNYTVSHTVSCPAGSNTSTKTDYITVMNSTALVTTAFRATDGATGNRITGATIHLKDVENGSWVNGSTTLGVATITVLQGHHISAYANATGFSDGEYLNAPAMAWTYDIMMLPTGFANVSAGNVTAYITVTDADTLQKLYGAQVNALYADGQGSHVLEATTNSAGVAQFVLPNNTNVHFSGIKSGYESSQLVLNTGTGSGGDAHVEGELKMSKLAVTPTITATTLPGGGTPTPTTTVLPGCEDLTTQEGKDKCNAAQGGEMMGFLYENGLMLIELCVAAIVFGLLGMIIKSF